MKSIGVLEPDQNPSVDQPSRYVKKNVAAILVRRLVARQISKRLIQMIVVKSIADFHIATEKPKITIWPRILPPRRPDWFFTSYPLPDLETCASTYAG